MNSDNIEMTLTVEESLNQMYQLALDHAIDITKDAMINDTIVGDSINSVLIEIIQKLQNLKSK